MSLCGGLAAYLFLLEPTRLPLGYSSVLLIRHVKQHHACTYQPDMEATKILKIMMT
jgi:hypothetical protein